MTSSITFLHTADLHLGAPMRGFRDLSPAWAARLQRAIPEAFDRMVDVAIARTVDFVIIAGDVFDSSGASYGDYLHFFESMVKLGDAGIPVYITPGNHDPYSSWHLDEDRLPPTCHLIGGEGVDFALYEREGVPLCLIGARGYRNQAWPIGEPIAQGIGRAQAIAALEAECPAASQAPFCVGVLHAGFDEDQSKAYCDPKMLMGADVDYWACGHVHKHVAKPSESQPRVAFPGCIQGRDLKETGERGCYLVTLSESSRTVADVQLEFISTASVVFHTVHVDVSFCKTLADIVSLVQARLFHENGKARCDQMVARIILNGTTALHEYLRRKEVLDDLRKRVNDAYPMFYCDALEDRTASEFDRDSVMREGLFRAHVLSVADEQRRMDERLVNYVQAELVKRGVGVPMDLASHMKSFNDAAETLVLDLLEEGRS